MVLGALCNADALAGDSEESRPSDSSELSQGWVGERTANSLIYSKESPQNSQRCYVEHMDEILGFHGSDNC